MHFVQFYDEVIYELYLTELMGSFSEGELPLTSFTLVEIRPLVVLVIFDRLDYYARD